MPLSTTPFGTDNIFPEAMTIQEAL